MAQARSWLLPSSAEVKNLWRYSSTVSSAKAKNSWSYNSTSPYIFMIWYLRTGIMSTVPSLL
jgi:hypothetical protein